MYTREAVDPVQFNKQQKTTPSRVITTTYSLNDTAVFLTDLKTQLDPSKGCTTAITHNNVDLRDKGNHKGNPM